MKQGTLRRHLLQCKVEAWDSKRWDTGCHWRLQGYKKLANGQLKKYRPGAGFILRDKKRRKNEYMRQKISKTFKMKKKKNTLLQASEEKAKSKTLLENVQKKAPSESYFQKKKERKKKKS